MRKLYQTIDQGSPVGNSVQALVRHLIERRLPWESDYKFNRRMAKRYNLDFYRNCVFPEMLRNHDNPHDAKICRIPMQSGRIAEFKSILVRWGWDDTGLQDWKFEFQRYVPNSALTRLAENIYENRKQN